MWLSAPGVGWGGGNLGIRRRQKLPVEKRSLWEFYIPLVQSKLLLVCRKWIAEL